MLGRRRTPSDHPPHVRTGWSGPGGGVERPAPPSFYCRRAATMRTVDQTTSAPSSSGLPTHDASRGRAARGGVPTIPLPRETAQATARTARPARAATAVPAQASTGIADLLRGPVRPARVLMTAPAAVYLFIPGERGGDVVGVLTSDAS